MYTLMLIDDNPMAVDLIKHCFGPEEINIVYLDGLDKTTSLNANELLQMDAFLVDYHFPHCSGKSIVSLILKKIGNLRPIFILTEETSQTVKLQLLEQPLADYLPKSLPPHELKLRIINKIQQSKEKFKIKNQEFEVDMEFDKLQIHGEEVELTQKEFKMMKFLIQNGSKGLRTDFLSNIWSDTQVLPATLNTHIYNINKKLKAFGYRLDQGQDEDHIVLIRKE